MSGPQDAQVKYLQDNADVVFTPTHDHDGHLLEYFVPVGALFVSEITIANQLVRIFHTKNPTVRVALVT